MDVDAKLLHKYYDETKVLPIDQYVLYSDFLPISDNLFHLRHNSDVVIKNNHHLTLKVKHNVR